jgi:hypothetical protein
MGGRDGYFIGILKAPGFCCLSMTGNRIASMTMATMGFFIHFSIPRFTALADVCDNVPSQRSFPRPQALVMAPIPATAVTPRTLPPRVMISFLESGAAWKTNAGDLQPSRPNRLLFQEPGNREAMTTQTLARCPIEPSA